MRVWSYLEPTGILAAALLVRAACMPLPAELRDAAANVEVSARYTDASGLLLREVRADGQRVDRLSARAADTLTARALVLAEDRRFAWHLGLDPIGTARAVWANVRGRREGASTLTMQLARALRPTPRTLLGKFEQAALALRIEASVSKRTILEAYLQTAPFGPQLRGADAAAGRLYGKSLAALSPAESATLAALPKFPGLALRSEGPLGRRRDWILQRMREEGVIDDVTLARGLAEPLPQRVLTASSGAPHLIEALRGGRIAGGGRGEIRLSLSLPLQASVEQAVRTQIALLGERHVGNGAAIVVDNASGKILAYVGSADFAGPEGQNDGLLAERQAGSALKPFVYALAMERGSFGPSSVMPDVPLRLETEEGVFAPQNYDHLFHGPVRAREALGNSYNVPAVWLADRVGVGPVLSGLRRLGLSTLRQGASYYGAALALGDGEVRLFDLAEAYSTLARDGIRKPLCATHTCTLQEERVLDRDVARVVTDMLADRHARAAAFGHHSVLDFDYPVAAKTGTSKGFRDNVTAGFSSEVTVVTWVGNFDGSPMHDVSGISGAGPLFRAVMELAMQGRTPRAFASPEGWQRAEICSLSGDAPGEACQHRRREWVRGAQNTCKMHEMIWRMPDGLVGEASCAGARRASLERYSAAYAAWARDARPAAAEQRVSPLCPQARGLAQEERAPLAIVEPADGARYQIDPGRSAQTQRLSLRVQGGVGTLRVTLDGAPLRGWQIPLEPGEHELVIADAHGQRRARYSVR